MDFKLNRWLRNEKIKSVIVDEKNLTKLNYCKASIIAILLGLIIGSIFVFSQGYNGFDFIFSSFSYSFDKVTLNKTLNYFAVYIFMGLGLALGFKVGIFNMGGSGQAILGMSLAIALIGAKAKSDGVTFTEVDKGFAIVILLVFLIGGVFVSTIAGLLKVFFNIHEVVTTVMLNWIIWYSSRWLMIDTKFGWPEWTAQVGHSTPILNSSWLSIGDNNWILGVMLAFASVIIMYLLITFTTFGFKFKVVGKQPQAAMYAGIKNRQFLILTTALQGFFIGFGAFFYWFNIKGSMLVGTEVLPSIGFDVIPVALVAFNNVLAIVPIALLWASLKSGSERAIGLEFIGLSSEVPSLMFGIIIYSSAVYILFLKFKPIEKMYLYLFELKCYVYQEYKIGANLEIANLKTDLKTIINKEDIVKLNSDVKNLKEEVLTLQKEKTDQEKLSAKKIELNNLTKALKYEIDNYVAIYKMKIKMKKQEMKMTFEEMKEHYDSNSYKGLRKKIKNEIRFEYFTLMDKFVLMQIERNEILHNFKLEKKHFSKLEEIVKLQNEIEKLSNSNSKEKIVELKSEIKNQKTKFFEEINLKMKELIKKYDDDARVLAEKFNEFKSLKNEELKNAQEKAKVFLTENSEKYKNEIESLKNNSPDKEVFKKQELEILVRKYKTEMEVVNKYAK